MNVRALARGAAVSGVLASGVGLLGAAPASASVDDPVLHTTVQSDYKASCSYAADLNWNRATNRLTGWVTVDNHLWFAACRLNLVVHFADSPDDFPMTVPIDTAAATTDPTAPSRISQPIAVQPAAPRREVPFIDQMTAELVAR
jgi:hypothetical protein